MLLNVGGGVTSNETTFTSASTTSDTPSDNTTTTATAITGYANYTSGNGTSELIFAYTVETGDATDRLDYSSPAAGALAAPFGAIITKDALEPVYLRSLPEPGTEGSLGWNTDITISDEVLLVERVSCHYFFRSSLLLYTRPGNLDVCVCVKSKYEVCDRRVFVSGRISLRVRFFFRVCL